MSDWKKYTGILSKIAEKSAEKLSGTTKDLSKKVNAERKKLEVKSQIGQHERQITKAYERLGEAYYKHTVSGTPMDGLDDIMEVIRSNQKVISLLEIQLKQLDN